MLKGNDLDAICINDLTRTFVTSVGTFRRKSKEITALDGVSLSIKEGELFGLLGPNGSGKTTITRILTTILLPTSGTVRLMGLDVVKDAQKLRPRLGMVFGGERGLYYRLSGRDNLQYFADLYRVPPQVSRRRIVELLELVGLAERSEERVETYSRGMKQRLHIARSLLHDPQCLFLDEPTNGLDPVAARDLRQLIRELKHRGKTIFLTSHYMFEIDALCDRVAVLSKGKILVINTPSALKSSVADLEVIEIEVLGAPAMAIDRLYQFPCVQTVHVEMREQTQVLQIQAAQGTQYVQEFLTLLGDVRILKVITRQPTLEDAYIRLVGSDSLRA